MILVTFNGAEARLGDAVVADWRYMKHPNNRVEYARVATSAALGPRSRDMHASSEAGIGWLAVVTGVFIAAAVAPWTSYFVPNFAAYWSPQLAVLLAMWFLNARPAAIAGAVMALAAYLCAFDWWFFAHRQGDSMAWLGYLFSWPGGLVGAVAATLWMRRRGDWRAAAVGAGTLRQCSSASS